MKIIILLNTKSNFLRKVFRIVEQMKYSPTGKRGRKCLILLLRKLPTTAPIRSPAARPVWIKEVVVTDEFVFSDRNSNVVPNNDW